MNEDFKPTQYTVEAAVRLMEQFGSYEAVPAELQTALCMIHMRLMEAEQEITYFWERVALYQSRPNSADQAASPPPPTSLAGEETGEF